MIKEFVELFFPDLCIACNDHLLKQEEFICSDCLYHLPQTNYHFNSDNDLSKTFWGRIPLETVCAFLYFKKDGSVQSLLHNLKYHGGKELAQFLGRYYGQKLKESDLKFDVVAAIPLHKSKLRKRGYNQSAWFAKGIAETLGISDLSERVVRNVATETQTRKDRFQRWQNVENIFSVSSPEMFSNKHVLIVDDVITTGATIEALCNTILQTTNCKLSVAAIATARD